MIIAADDLLAMLEKFIWVFARIAAMVSVAPIFGSRTVPKKVKLIMAVVISIAVYPMINHTVNTSPMSFQGFLILAEQIIIGSLIGFTLVLLFDALITGGQTIAQLMGLGFASMMDPQNGVSVPVVGQFYTILATLLFLAVNGHLIIIEMTAESFKSIPIGMTLSSQVFIDIAIWAKWVFLGAIMVALPSIVALLIVNIAFGVMTRAAPQLNIFAVGFPITILFGFFVMILTLSHFVDKFMSLVTELTVFVRAVF